MQNRSVPAFECTFKALLFDSAFVVHYAITRKESVLFVSAFVVHYARTNLFLRSCAKSNRGYLLLHSSGLAWFAGQR